MIHFELRCEPEGHLFDGWFRSGADFDQQAAHDLVACPRCGATAVGKSLMRPAVAGKGEKTTSDVATFVARMHEMARGVRANADYVGPKFAEEARRIHFGETATRQIYGEASPTEVKSLLDDGIPALPLPPLPEDHN